MTNPKLGFKLRLRNFRNRAASFYNKWTHQDLLNLLMAIVAILIAINGNNISKASYELSKSDTSQTAQINELRRVIINQDAQQQALLNTLQELKTQNLLSQESNKELKLQGEKISMQSVTIAEQLKLNREERHESLSRSVIENKNNLTRLRKFFYDFIILLPLDRKDSLNLYVYENRKQFYQTLKLIFERNDDNPLILTSDSLFSKLNLSKTMVQLSLNSITKSKSIDAESKSYISGQPINLSYFEYLLQNLDDLSLELDKCIRKTSHPELLNRQ